MKIVHIGLMKSGTTFVQHAFAASRPAFCERGFLYPGQMFNQQHACYGLCGRYIPWVTPRQKWSAMGKSMLKEISTHDGDVLISSEALSSMSSDGIAYFCELVGGVDRIVITVRNFAKILLSAWQQSIKGGGKSALDDFLWRVERDRTSTRGIWTTYSFGSIAKKWRLHAEVELIVVGQSSCSEDDPLLAAFGRIMGFPIASPEKLSESERNVSLFFEDVEVLRYVNILFNEAPRRDREQMIRRLLRKHLFPATSHGSGRPIAIPYIYAKKAERWAESEIAELPSDVVVHGNFEDLTQTEDVPQSEIENLDQETCFKRLVKIVAKMGK